MKNDVHQFVQQCQVCQQSKSEHVKVPSLLQPLPIPKQAWQCMLVQGSGVNGDMWQSFGTTPISIQSWEDLHLKSFMVILQSILGLAVNLVFIQLT